LEVNQEKLLLLIVVDDHLEQFFHLHPENIGKGKFELKFPLEKGSYKAFVDIKSKSLNYQVQPLAFLAGEPQKEHSHETLVPDTSLVKTNDGQTAELEVSYLRQGSQ
jgi:hypothetical protein